MGQTRIKRYADWYNLVKRDSGLEPCQYYSVRGLLIHFDSGTTIRDMVTLVKKTAAKQ